MKLLTSFDLLPSTFPEKNINKYTTSNMFDVSEKIVVLILGKNSCIRHQTKTIGGSNTLTTPPIKKYWKK